MQNNSPKNQVQNLYLVKKNPDVDAILTVEEAASMLKVKATTLRTWINRNNIPKDLYKKIGGTIRFSRRAIEEYMNI